MTSLRTRRLSLATSLLIALVAVVFYQQPTDSPLDPALDVPATDLSQPLASKTLSSLAIKGRAPKTGYARDQFGSGWRTEAGCGTRNIILARDLDVVKTNELCQVISGKLNDPYTGKLLQFRRGKDTSRVVQIDHVVALSNAWQTGAQLLTYDVRIEFANDPLNLLAVDGPANQQKGDADAASWLPSYKPYRCPYVARQVAVKSGYSLWVTPAEKTAMERVLHGCPDQRLPSPS